MTGRDVEKEGSDEGVEYTETSEPWEGLDCIWLGCLKAGGGAFKLLSTPIER